MLKHKTFPIVGLFFILTPPNIQQIKYSIHPQLIITLTHFYETPYMRILLIVNIIAMSVTYFCPTIFVFSGSIFIGINIPIFINILFYPTRHICMFNQPTFHFYLYINLSKKCNMFLSQQFHPVITDTLSPTSSHPGVLLKMHHYRPTYITRINKHCILTCPLLFNNRTC